MAIFAKHSSNLPLRHWLHLNVITLSTYKNFEFYQDSYDDYILKCKEIYKKAVNNKSKFNKLVCRKIKKEMAEKHTKELFNSEVVSSYTNDGLI